jgi:ribosomal protein S18 acetylase RimI-like enzyme
MLPPSVPKREGLAMTGIVVTALRLTDRERWTELWRGYLDFYETSLPPETYEHTWQRLIAAESSIRGLGARLGGEDAPLVGIVHYLFHAHAWSAKEVCYLQDLFVDPASRRHGVGRELIDAVAAVAHERGCLRLYWTTREDNATARSLYDRIARFSGFIRYDYALDRAPLRHRPRPGVS